jgi:hypothetical protein
VADTEWKWPEAVAIESTRDDTVAGLDPGFEKQWEGPDHVFWFEGNHRRIFELSRVLEQSADLFRFEDIRGDVFELRPLTLELYRKQVRQHTVGRPDFDTLGQLLAAMRREW